VYKSIASIVLALLLGQSLHAQSVLSVAEWAEDAPTEGEFLLDGVNRPGLGSAALLLRPLMVYTPDAKLVIVEPDGSERPLPRPPTRFYRGELLGEPGSRVFLSITEHGAIFGLIDGLAEMQTLLPKRDSAGRLIGLDLARVDSSRLDGNAEPFVCEQDRLPLAPADIHAARSGATGPLLPEGTLWRARVAIDTDFEFFQQFASAAEATDYVANLVGFASTIYVDELDTEMQVSYLRLWNSAADPWVQSSSICALYEFGKHWNDNMAGESRTIAHLLSGKNTGGGVAWVGVLCNGGFNYNASGDGCPGLGGTSNYGGGYGFTGEMSGNFDPGNPTAVWDIVASAHEIGHNFDSPHTHCYNGLGGNPSPVDQCYGVEPGCYAGAASLPGPQGQGSGTIMSYCHLRPGGMSNISLTLGQGHGFGVAPERVPQRMRSHVQSRAGSFPQCLATGALAAPAAPATTAGTSIGNNGFTANWTRPAGSTGFFLDLSTQANFSSFVAGYQDLAVGAVQSHVITGLAAGTTYHYRVRAANGGGTSGNSNVTQVTTSGGGGNQTLSVNRTGTGTGTVSSVPAGIDCGATCSADFPNGTVVDLTPQATIGSVFAGWSGDCSGSGACSVSMIQARNVTATFDVLDGSLEEGFETVSGGCVDGWICVNNSATIGSTGWFQGASTTFPAQAGGPTEYIAANFNNTTGTNTISNWLISPQVNFEGGSELRFWTRTVDNPQFPDRIEVRLSSAGASTNVGSTAASVGDFGTLLTTVNPSLLASAGSCPPGAGGYPIAWCEIVLGNLDGIPASGIGRIAFRYHVTNGGPNGANSNYIGIDTVSFAAPAVMDTPPTIGYDPTASSTISYSVAGTAAPISATPSGGSGSGAAATTTVGACNISGGGAAFPNTSIAQLSFVGASTTPQNLVLPACVPQSSQVNATLTCPEVRGGGAPSNRVWTLQCPVANTPPSIAYAPTTSSTISYSAAGTAAPISATPSGGSGSGAAATTTVGACNISGGGAAFPNTNIGQLSFVGATTTPQNLALPACVPQSSQVNATLTCPETRGGGAPSNRVWTLQCPVANTPPSIAYDPNASTTISYSAAGTAAPISATPSGGSGSGAAATTTVGACNITGGGAAFPTTSIGQLSFVGATTTPQNMVLPACVPQEQPTSATLTCPETRAGSAPLDRMWTLQCSGGPMVFEDGFED
jgi:hypothetical protein